MFNITHKRSIGYTIAILLTTIVLGYFYPGKAIITCGFMMAIFFTIFIPYHISTIVVGAVSISIATIYPLVHHQQTGSFTGLTENLFIMILLFASTVLSWYIKSLLNHLQFDRTHMTSLFENATEGILLTDGKGMIILSNPSAHKIFGYTAEELKGQPVEMLIPSSVRPHHHKLRESFYKAPSNRTMGSGRDLFAIRKNTEEFPVEVSLSHYTQENQRYVIAFVVDITARKEIERNIRLKQEQLEMITHEVQLLNTQLEGKVKERTSVLQEALGKLEQSQNDLSEALEKEKQLNELKSRFVSMASHEFRTPLTTILSSATLVSKYPLQEDNEKRLKHINRIKESVKHMNDLLEDFLSLGRLEDNKVNVLIDSFLPKAFIEEVVDEMKGQIKEGQSIVLNYAGEERFSTDKRLLKNIIINLLSNAIKFSNAGEAITITASVSHKMLTLAVKDRGIGIPPEDVNQLFDSFFRSKNAINIQGTGLGLPIIKRYLSLINGEIEVSSELNKGSVFTIRLPFISGTAQHQKEYVAL